MRSCCGSALAVPVLESATRIANTRHSVVRRSLKLDILKRESSQSVCHTFKVVSARVAEFACILLEVSTFDWGSVCICLWQFAKAF